MNAQKAMIGAAAFALALGAIWIYRRGLGGAAEDVAKGAVSAVTGAATGAVKGVAGAVGIPDTEDKKCRDALAAGDYWNASFFCPAGTFLSEGAKAAAGSVTELFGGSPEVKTPAKSPEQIEEENFSDWPDY